MGRFLFGSTGRSDNSPGEDAYLQGEYGSSVVLGGQGAHPNGTYPYGEYRKVIHEMKHFTAYSDEAGASLRRCRSIALLQCIAPTLFKDILEMW